MLVVMKNLRHFFFWTLTFLFAAVLLELASLVFLYSSGEASWDYFNRYHPDFSKVGSGVSPDLLAEIFGEVKAHPYFGFTFFPREANNEGFKEAENYPYQKKKGELRLGIFGASTAEQLVLFAKENDSLTQAKFRQYCGLSADSRVKFLNFSVSGGRQPQQFFIASYFLGSADLFVNLDGQNEALDLVFSSYPLEYPASAEHYASYSSKAAEKREIDDIRGRMRALLMIGQGSVLRHSSLVYLVVSRLAKISQKRIELLIGKISANVVDYRAWLKSQQSDDKKKLTYEELVDLKVDIWERYTLLQKTVVESHKKEFFDFLLPNPFVIDGKIFTPEEIKLKHAFLAEEAYPRSGQALQKIAMRADGLKTPSVRNFQLLFRDVPQTVYLDGCCHLNPLGNRLLLEALVKSLCQHSRILRSNF